MWYNTQRKTKPIRAQSSRYRNNYYNPPVQNVVNPKERLMNNQKREKLRNLLIDRFAQKYNIAQNKNLIEGEITKFLQQEKLNDVDLKRLDAKLKRMISGSASKVNLKANLTKNLNYNAPPQIQPKANLHEEESIYPTNLKPPEEPKVPSRYDNNNLSQNNKATIRPGSYQRPPRPLSSQTYIAKDNFRSSNFDKNKNKFKNPEEELAALEKELAEEEARELRENGYYQLNNDIKLDKLDFKKYGNEWAAMAAYDKKIYEQQLLEEKIRSAQLKKKTKADLDEQVKAKVKKEYEEELKEKEYDKLFKEHQKELDKIEKEKEELVRQQYLREKQSREAQLKDNYVRRKIDQLKEKKFDKKIIKNIKKEIEREKQQAEEEKRRRNTELNKALKENEENRKNKKKI